MSRERLERFFDKDEHTYRVKKEIRDMVVFAPQDVLRDPPFSRVDICHLPQPAHLPRAGDAAARAGAAALRAARRRLPVPRQHRILFGLRAPVRSHQQEMAHLPAHRQRRNTASPKCRASRRALYEDSRARTSRRLSQAARAVGNTRAATRAARTLRPAHGRGRSQRPGGLLPWRDGPHSCCIRPANPRATSCSSCARRCGSRCAPRCARRCAKTSTPVRSASLDEGYDGPQVEVTAAPVIEGKSPEYFLVSFRRCTTQDAGRPGTRPAWPRSSCAARWSRDPKASTKCACCGWSCRTPSRRSRPPTRSSRPPTKKPPR